MKKDWLPATGREDKGSQAPVAHSCNTSYLGGRDWEDHSSRSAQTNSLRDFFSKITRAKWTGLAQVAEHLLCKCDALSSNSSANEKIERQKEREREREGERERSYFQSNALLARGNHGNFMRGAIHIHIGRHCRVDTFPSMLSVRSEFKKERWRLHLWACPLEVLKHIWKVKGVDRDTFGHAQLVS
jgi:hypothetical protein